MSELQVQEKVTGLPVLTFTNEQIQLIKDTVAQGTTDNEFALFLYTAKSLGLNPLLRQIHAVKRWDSKLKREAMAIQIGIDGLRLKAEETKKYSPGRETTYIENEDGGVVSATAYIKKQTEDGTWHEVSATAYYSEFCQKTKDGTANRMWATMPHSQLAKCAEALAIRKAFPMLASGVRTDEEMGQADNIDDGHETKEPIKSPVAKKPEGESAQNAVVLISEPQRKRFFAIFKGSGKTDEEVKAKLLEVIGSESSADIPKDKYNELCAWAESGDAQE